MTRPPDDSEAVDLGTLVRLIGVPRNTIKGWMRPGLLEEPSDGRYFEREVVEAALVAGLVGSLTVADVARLWPERGAALVDRALGLRSGQRLDLLISTSTLATELVASAPELDRAVGAGEPFVLAVLADRALEARAAFARFKGTVKFVGDRRRTRAEKGQVVRLEPRRHEGR